MNDVMISILSSIDAWSRKLVQIHGSFYVSIPPSLIHGSGKKKGSIVKLRRVVDEKSGKLLLLVEL